MFCSSNEVQPFIYLLSRFQSKFPCLSSALDSPTEFGFLAYGVYRVPLCRFPDSIVTVALLKLFIHRHALGSKDSRQNSLPGLIVSSGANTTSNRSSCEHGLSSDYTISDRITYMNGLTSKNFIFQTGQPLQYIQVIAVRLFRAEALLSL